MTMTAYFEKLTPTQISLDHVYFFNEVKFTFINENSAIFVQFKSKLLNPKRSPVHPGSPLSIQANSEYLILRRMARLGWALFSQKYSLLYYYYYYSTALRLAIYSWTDTKFALTGPHKRYWPRIFWVK